MTARQIQEAQELQTSMLDQQLKLLSLKSKTRKKAEAKMGGGQSSPSYSFFNFQCHSN